MLIRRMVVNSLGACPMTKEPSHEYLSKVFIHMKSVPDEHMKEISQRLKLLGRAQHKGLHILHAPSQ